jgi:hypothetical protein
LVILDGSSDPFDVNEPNPAKCGAEKSCLWELKTLTKHAIPDAAEFAARILRKPLPRVESSLTNRINTNMDYVSVKNTAYLLEYDTIENKRRIGVVFAVKAKTSRVLNYRYTYCLVAFRPWTINIKIVVVPMKKNGHVKTELRAVRHFLTLFFFKS